MASIIRTSFRTTSAKNFIESYAAPTASNVLYLGIGHDTPWANEVSPPAPVDSIQERKALYDGLLGAHKVEKNDISLVVPRIDWTLNTEYFVADETLANPFAQDTYVMTTAFRVYKCITKDISGTTYANPPVATTEPTGTGTGINTSDGYTWEFLYDLSPYDYTTLLTASWLPLNYGPGIKETALQAASGDVAANVTLASKYVMVRGRIADTDLNTGITYRQVGIVENPLNVADSSAATAVNYVNPSDPNGTPAGQAREWSQYSGNVIYQENRVPVTRSIGQFEEIKIIIEF